jgi:hypothetical protein
MDTNISDGEDKKYTYNSGDSFPQRGAYSQTEKDMGGGY